MKLVVISDTHNKHREMTVDDGDVLIHCGDFTGMGREKEIVDFIEWLGNLPHRHKILIAGNHDWGMDGDNQIGYETFINRRTYGNHLLIKPIENRAISLMNQYGITYLKSSGVEIDGVKFWGSPVQPEFHGWAFNKFRGPDIKAEWDKIPDDTNVLITHGPMYGVKDRCLDGRRVGCEELYHKIKTLTNLKVHCFGHIHEDRGITKVLGVTYVNASSLDLYYNVNKEHTFVLNYEDL